jgi:hypothetical protein
MPEYMVRVTTRNASGTRVTDEHAPQPNGYAWENTLSSSFFAMKSAVMTPEGFAPAKLVHQDDQD